MNRTLRKVFFPLVFLSCFAASPGVFAQEIDAGFADMLDSLYIKKVQPILACELARLKGAYILDAREQNEFQVSHLKNARHVGYIWFDMRRVYTIPREAPVVVYCAVGSRSEKIAQKLQKAGFSQVYNLYGGIFQWINEGYPVYRPDGIQTSEIHTYIPGWTRWLNRGTKVN